MCSAVIGYMKTFALDDESSRWIKNHSYITVMRIRCRDINLVNVWLWENFVLPNVRTDVVQSQKMSNKLKIILSEEKRTRSIYRFSEDTTTFECMKGDIWESSSWDGGKVKNTLPGGPKKRRSMSSSVPIKRLLNYSVQIRKKWFVLKIPR